MAGDPSNASLWADADVYVGPTDAENPVDVDTEFGEDWDLVGLLDGDDGFSETRDEEIDQHYAWGGILVRTSRKNFTLTKTFTALEDNETTRSLIWPGSTESELVVPRPERIKIAFEVREGDVVKRLISAFEAEVTVNGDLTENEGDLTKYPLVATIFPDGDGVLFVRQKSPDAS